LKVLVLKSLEKSYFLPISVYWPDVTKSCNTSRCADIGCCIQASMRQERNLARVDMAGLSNFMLASAVNGRRKVTPDGPLREDNLFF
jgi:hypothetical protein